MGASDGGDSWANHPMLFSLGITVLLFVALGLLLMIILFRKAKKESYGTINKKINNNEIFCQDYSANYIGMESKKYKQIRGSSVLVLTKDELFGIRLLPKLEVSIPLKSIESVETPKSVLGKGGLNALLKVRYRTKHGGMDAVVWHVRNLEQFKKNIEKLMAS